MSKNLPTTLVLCVTTSLLFLAAGLFFYGPTATDDPHTTFGAAWNLAQHGEFLNFNAARLEQGTSTLQVLFLAPLAIVFPDNFITAANISSIVFGIASVIVCIFLIVKYSALSKTSLWLLIICLGLAPMTVFWAMSGMEPTLQCFFLLLLCFLFNEYLSKGLRGILPAIIIVTLCNLLVRPEAVFVIGCALVGIFVGYNIKHDEHEKTLIFKRLPTLLGILISCFLLVMLARYLYFGAFFPQAVTAKVTAANHDATFFARKILPGLKYLKISVFGGLTTSILFLSGLILVFIQTFSRNKNTLAYFSLMLVFAQTSFLITSGGDWMPGGRFFAPVFLILLISVPVLLPRKFTTPFLGVLLLTTMLDTAFVYRFKTPGIPLHQNALIEIPEDYPHQFSIFETHNILKVRDIASITLLDQLIRKLKEEKQNEKIVFLSGEMGMVPFYMNKLHFGDIELIDKRGLATRHLTDCDIRHAEYGQTGINIDYFKLMAQYTHLYCDCGVPLPDIIWDIGNDWRMKALRGNGFPILFIQHGFAKTENYKQNIGEFIAIRGDLTNVEIPHPLILDLEKAIEQRDNIKNLIPTNIPDEWL